MKGLLGLLTGGGNTGVAVGLPAGQNMVEGTEASIMVGAASANAGRRKAWLATVAALVTLIPYLAGLWFLFQYEPGRYIDYAIAVLIFVIGVREVKEGLEGRPKAGQRRRVVLEGPLGLDLVDPGQIETFQGEHGLEQDGVLGPRTRGAVLAELRERGEEPRPNALGVDVTDEESVRAFQRRVGLDPDGVVGPRTQGAMAAEGARPLPEPADPDDVRRFQRRFRLPETGEVDARTQGAMRATRPEQSGAVASTVPDGRGPRAAYGVDLTDPADVSRFRREHGLGESRTVDARAQGALRAEVERRHRQPDLDPVDPEAVRRFQEAHGLEPTGAVDAPTQTAVQTVAERRGTTSVADRTVLGIDPTDPESVRRFQALHGVEPTGEIDEDTQRQLGRTEEWTAGIDLTDPTAVARLQSAHGLEPTGAVDAPTQGVLRRYRTSLRERHGDVETTDADASADGWYPLDPTDAGSIRSFQREHGLEETGIIGTRTQGALRAAVAERTGEAVHRAASEKGGRSGLLGSIRDAWPAYLGVLFEGGEAGLFTIGIAHGTGTYSAAAAAGGGAFVAPWVAFAFLRDWIESWPNWLFELVIGIILASAATIFGLFRATGIFG